MPVRRIGYRKFKDENGKKQVEAVNMYAVDLANAIRNHPDEWSYNDPRSEDELKKAEIDAAAAAKLEAEKEKKLADELAKKQAEEEASRIKAEEEAAAKKSDEEKLAEELARTGDKKTLPEQQQGEAAKK